MTEPQQPGKHSQIRRTSKGISAVRRETDTLTDQDDATTATTQPAESSAKAKKGAGRAARHNPSSDPDADSETDHDAEDGPPTKAKRRINRSRLLPYAVLPALALLLAIAAGYLKWQNVVERSREAARIESVAAAKDATIALLSYQPDTAEKDLDAARDLLTGSFKDSYMQLTHDVVVPGAKQKHISAVATVPAVASVSATPNHVVALLFVNQTMVVGGGSPTDTVSSVRVTLDKINDRWLISEFDPI
jgi:Mce-associated membrane protein